MKLNLLIIVLLLIGSQFGYGQESKGYRDHHTRKGDFYFYWGWNSSRYTTSDIHFSGTDYNITLDNVIANDRPTAFNVDPYFHPRWFTIPQYNFRIGYFLNDQYSVSLGADHMKYVMQSDQTVRISGEISNSGTEYDGVYDNEDIVLAEGFLEFEHTDGLNYINIEARRIDELMTFRYLTLALTEGLGGGVVYPRTNVTLLNNDRYDEFNVAGYGISSVLGLQLNIGRHFFIQSEIKGGFVNLPNVRTTSSSSDMASQSFWFGQFNVVFGASWNLKNKG
ncbi:hypothetical protein [Lewinella cohaerens]|uniref:hypothetical protein n=1 Tax=Lewinella cohaerens TaxID=70995 RepID=UPI00039F5E38|nr:hypothetical protein [Lewinella cohaerens]